MKTAAIVIDDWKLPIFQKTLDGEGYKYTQFKGPAEGCITLKVETDSIAKLQPVVERMNADAAESKKTDKPKRCLTDGGEITPDHREINPETGQQKGYVVLCPEERAKGYVRPFRKAYKHNKCGSVTTMADSIAETYARDPSFYNGTFCVGCRAHFPLDEFVWEGTDEIVGS